MLYFRSLLLLITLSPFFAFSAPSPATIDQDAQQILNQLNQPPYLNNYDKMQPLILSLESNVEKISSEELSLKANYAILDFYTVKGKSHEEFKPSFDNVLRLSEKLGQFKYAAWAMNLEGGFYQNLSNYVAALASYKKAQTYSSSKGLKRDEAGSINNLASLYEELQLYDKAIDYFNKAIQIENYDLFKRNLVYAYLSKGKISLAKKLAFQLNDANQTPTLFNRLALIDVYLAEKELAPIKKIFDDIKQGNLAKDHMLSSYLALTEGRYLYHKGEYQASLSGLKTALQDNFFHPGPDKEDSLLMLAKAYSNLSKYQLSNEIYLQYLKRARARQKQISEAAILVLLAEGELIEEQLKQKQLATELHAANLQLILNDKIKLLTWGFVFLSSFAFVVIVTYLFRRLKSHKARATELAIVSSVDELTQINNRRSLLNELRALTKVTPSSKFCLAIIDIDHFKRINDSYGHQAGDDVLVQFANLLSSHIREKDIVGRYGGEEFIIIFKDSDLATAKESLQRLLSIVSNFAFPDVGQVTFSAGISQFNNESIENLINNADERLYLAKDRGRNQIVI